MTTRKIKDAKDLSINELIYFKGHAQATYLSDGRTVEEAIPTKTSDLTNDSGFITINDVPEVEVPTKTSDLENNSGFVTSADNIASATKLQTTRYINGVGFDGTRDICNYAVCGTSASTATKVVTVNSDFDLQSGSKVTVKFNFPNTNSSPKLNVNNTGGRTMRYKGVNISNSFTFNGEALYTFNYDGTYWVLEGDWDSINKQDTLVSGTNIKTINGASILGSGNITIEGGGNNVDTSSFATKETVMTDEIAVNADGFTTTDGKWFALPGTDSENNSDFCIATFDDIPTSTSELENNSGFITINDVDIPTSTSDLTNDSGFITIDDVPEVTVPTKTSDLENNSGFVTSADNIASATKLKTTRYINGVGFDGTKDIYNYVVCGTSASTAAKTATVNSDFKLQSGSKVTIKFNYPNTNTTPTLNVNSTGAKRMKYKGNYISNSFVFNSEALYTFIYDGTYWVLEGDWDSITSDTVSDWGFTKNIGTITGVTMNGVSKGTSGVVNLGTVVTDVSNKQDTLESGTNIKTINGISVLGSGDISIPDEVELIEISGDMLADEPTYTATEAQAIIDAYNANKLIALHDSATRNYGNGWFIPSIFVRSLQTIRQIYISGVIANFYIEQCFNYDTSSGSVATVYINRKLDLSEIGGSSAGGSSMYAYGTCSTAAGTGTKVVTLTDSNFTVSTGSIVAVKFTYTNSVATTLLKLSVGDVTAQIKYLNTTFLSNQHWSAGSVVEFIYDGSAWQVLGTIKDNVGTDTKVNQTITTTNSTYPLLFSATANKSTTSADGARFNSNLKYNPSTDTLTVGNISSNIPGVTDGGANLLGTCSSTAASATKVINISGVNLTTGSRVWIYFSNGNSYLGDMTCTINHKGTQITGAKISINNAIGGSFTSGNTQYSDYDFGIVFDSGYYEFIFDVANNVGYLRMTNNYFTYSSISPELHVKTGSTTGYNILISLTPGIHTVFDNPGLVILSANTIYSPNKSYSFEFTSGIEAPTLSLPTSIKWANGAIPTWEANTTYHISIVNNCAVCASFKTVS